LNYNGILQTYLHFYPACLPKREPFAGISLPDASQKKASDPIPVLYHVTRSNDLVRVLDRVAAVGGDERAAVGLEAGSAVHCFVIWPSLKPEVLADV